jgi:hypothetical protein
VKSLPTHRSVGEASRLAGTAGRGYPLIEDRIQAGIMRYVQAVDRPVSRSELTEFLGVSRSKVSMEVGRLLEAGLLVEEGLAESEGGRRSSLLRIPRSAGLVAAVDLGATSIDVALSTLGGGLLAHVGGACGHQGRSAAHTGQGQGASGGTLR